MSADQLQRGMTYGVAVRYLFVDILEAVRVAVERHGLDPGAARLCAEGMVAGALMSGHIKGDERLTVQLQTEAPQSGLLCDIHASGSLRARFKPNVLSVESTSMVNGMLLVIKHNKKRELYRGISAIENESIESALKRYLKQSEQVDSALKIAVEQTEQGELIRAFGVVIERLPPVPDLPEISPIEFHQKYDVIETMTYKELNQQLQSGELLGHDLHPLQSKRMKWECNCSMKRIENMLKSLGKNELAQMIEEDGRAEVVCDYCNAPYRLGLDDLNRLLNDLLKTC